MPDPIRISAHQFSLVVSSVRIRGIRGKILSLPFVSFVFFVVTFALFVPVDENPVLSAVFSPAADG